MQGQTEKECTGNVGRAAAETLHRESTCGTAGGPADG